jgi:hypothetical protein
MSTAAPKRRWLTFSLRTFLVVTLALSLVLGYFGRAWLKAYRDSQPPALRELAQIARRHGIPMPPKDAKLVLALNPGWEDGGVLPVYTPAFLLRDPGDGTALLLRGWKEQRQDSQGLVPPGLVCRPYSLDLEQAAAGRYRLECGLTSSLLCAIQLLEQGNEPDAEALYQRVRQQAFLNSPLPPKESSTLPDLRALVRHLAYLQIEDQLQNGPRHWPEVRERLSRLLEESDDLRNAHGQLLEDLAATIAAPVPAPESVEALLLACSFKGIREDELMQRGFDAVPELIRLRTDRRMTVFTFDTERRDETQLFYRVGDFAERMLRAISGGDERDMTGQAEMSDVDAEADQTAWEKWWAQTRDQNERDYYVRHFFWRSSSDGIIVRPQVLQILQHKYSIATRDLGDEYLKVVGADASRADVAEAMQKLDLGEAELIEMLTRFAQEGPFIQRRAVLRRLSEFDEDCAVKLLVDLLHELPADVQAAEAVVSTDAFPKLAMVLKNPQLKQMYVQAAWRNVSARMELLSRLAYYYSREEDRTERIALLAEFLDDETRRDLSESSAGFFSDDLGEIALGDFAAVHLAKLLDIEAAPNKKRWTPEQWAALHKLVRERLKQEKLPELE